MDIFTGTACDADFQNTKLDHRMTDLSVMQVTQTKPTRDHVDARISGSQSA